MPTISTNIPTNPLYYPYHKMLIPHRHHHYPTDRPTQPLNLNFAPLAPLPHWLQKPTTKFQFSAIPTFPSYPLFNSPPPTLSQNLVVSPPQPQLGQDLHLYSTSTVLPIYWKWTENSLKCFFHLPRELYARVPMNICEWQQKSLYVVILKIFHHC